MNCERIIFSLVLSVTLIGCGNWQAEKSYSHAVFSEKGDKVAAVYQKYEKKGVPMGGGSLNKLFESQVVLIGDNGEKTYLDTLMLGEAIEIFYQEAAGYVIIGRMGNPKPDSSGHDVTWLTYDLVGVDGSVMSLDVEVGAFAVKCSAGMMPTLRPIRWIPSPDGKVLARLQAKTTCASRTRTLTFIDAKTLKDIGNPIDLGPGSKTQMPNGASVWSQIEVSWVSNQKIAFAEFGDEAQPGYLNADVYTVGNASAYHSAFSYDCFSSPTASAKTAGGTEVQINKKTGTVSFQAAFGGALQCNEL